MAYAILRVSKITCRNSATSSTQHNYRTQLTPNADPEQLDRNQELLNLDKRNYWDLANERIQELGITRVRGDAVRAVEVLLTASPEAALFGRDAQQQTRDMRDSPWVQDNLHFLQQRYGAGNVVSFTLHQDEITPHIHAVVIPITQEQRLHKGERVGAVTRLSCRDVFGPSQLRQLQTDYAKAMAPHGLERGVKYSTAIHQDVRRHYGAQQSTQQQLAETAMAIPHTTLVPAAPDWRERFTPQALAERQAREVNEHAARQLAEANAKLAQLADIAAAHALAHDRARVLAQQLATSKAQHEQTKEQLAQKERALTEQSTKLTTQQQQYTQLVVQTARGQALAPELVTLAAQVQAQSQARAGQVLADVLRGPVTKPAQLTEALQAHGYSLHKVNDQSTLVRESATQAEFALTAVRPNGQEVLAQFHQAVTRTQAEQEQQRRQALAQDPKASHTVIMARDAAQAERIEQDLQKAGANVWQRQALPDQRVELRVSYGFDWQTIAGISRVLDRVQRLEGTQLEESHAHRTVRTQGALTAQRSSGPRQGKYRGPSR